MNAVFAILSRPVYETHFNFSHSNAALCAALTQQVSRHVGLCAFVTRSDVSQAHLTASDSVYLSNKSVLTILSVGVSTGQCRPRRINHLRLYTATSPAHGYARHTLSNATPRDIEPSDRRDRPPTQWHAGSCTRPGQARPHPHTETRREHRAALTVCVLARIGAVGGRCEH